MLVFEPPLANLDQDSTDGTFVAASLSKKPKGRVTMYLEAPNLIFSKCKLTFTPKNWNKQQVIKVSPVPYLTEAAADREIKAKFCCCSKDDPDMHKSCQEYPVTRNKGQGCTCTAYGDPHYTSFSGKLFDFQGQGAHYVIKSDALSVQQLNNQWMGGAATVQTKVALRYHNTVYIFDGNTKTAQLASESNEGVHITEVPGVSWRAALSDGSTVTVSYNGAAPNFHLGTAVTLGQRYKGSIQGLCGDFGNPNLVMANGLPGPDPNQFGASWKVTDDDNIFTLGVKASSVVASNTVSVQRVTKSKCKVPDLEDDEADGRNIAEQGEVEVKKFGTFKPHSKTELMEIAAAPKADAKEPTQAWLEAAKIKCTAMLTIAEVNAILAPTKFIQECVDDCMLSKSYDFLESSKRAYLSAVREYAKSAKAEPAINGASAAAQSLSEAVTKACTTAGLGSDVDCPNNCGGHGVCTYNGCACKSGYTGLDCSRKIPRSPPEDRSYTDKPATLSLDVKTLPKAKICDGVKRASQEEVARKRNSKKKSYRRD
jgi:hypothetical protein